MPKLWTHPDGSLITIDGKLAYCDECPCTTGCQAAVDAAALRYEAATGTVPTYNTSIGPVANIRNWLNAVAGQYHQGLGLIYPYGYLSTSNNYPSTNYMPEGLTCEDVWPYINELRYMRRSTFAVTHQRPNAGTGWNIGSDTGTWKHLCADNDPYCDTSNPTWYGYGLDEPADYSVALANLPTYAFVSGGSGIARGTYYRFGTNAFGCNTIKNGEWYTESVYEYMHRISLRLSGSALYTGLSKRIHYYTRLVIGTNEVFEQLNGFIGSRDEYTLIASKNAGLLSTIDSDPIGPSDIRSVPSMPDKRLYTPENYYRSSYYGCAIDSHFAIVEWLFP